MTKKIKTKDAIKALKESRGYLLIYQRNGGISAFDRIQECSVSEFMTLMEMLTKLQMVLWDRHAQAVEDATNKTVQAVS